MITAYVLWIVVAMAALAAGAAHQLHLVAMGERSAMERLELRAGAISGLAAYRAVLLEHSDVDYVHLAQPFRSDSSFCRFLVADDIEAVVFQVLDSASELPAASRTGTGFAVPTFGSVDEESRINLLAADRETLARIPGVSQAMAASLDGYRERRGAPLCRLADLRDVPGWEGADLWTIAPLVTFHGSGRVNVNTALPPVLRALGLSDVAVTEMERFLAGPDRMRRTGDDRYFKGVSEIVPRLAAEHVEPSIVEEWSLQAVAQRITTRSEYFRVRVRAARRNPMREDAALQYEVDAIVRADSSSTVVEWAEHAAL